MVDYPRRSVYYRIGSRNARLQPSCGTRVAVLGMKFSLDADGGDVERAQRR